MSVTIKGDKELAAKLKKLSSMQPVINGLQAGALHVKGAIANYPARRNIRPGEFQFVSDKQRRFFFAALKDGRIQVPYVRGQGASQRLGQRWTIKPSHGGLTQTVGNNASYGPFVQDQDRQTTMHKRTGWPTTEKVAKIEGPKVLRMVQKEVDKALAGP